MHVTYRTPYTVDELESVIELQRLAWGMKDLDIVPIHALRTSLHNGGVVIGAEHAGRCVGFVFGIPGRRDGRWIMWSYMMGIHPNYQGQGIGYQLKQEQRRWALDNGYEHMAWTFDPLRTRTAYFNLRKLGAYADRYHPDFYGSLTDEGALPRTDRLEVTWDLSGEKAAAPATEPTHVFKVESHGRYEVIHEPDWTHAAYAIDIPCDLDGLLHVDPELVQGWQARLGDLMPEAFRRGYRIVDFASGGGRCYYVLVRQG